MTDHDAQLDPTQNTRDWIDQKFNSLRSEMRMLFVVAVAGNGLLSHLSVGTTIGYIGPGVVFGGAICVKLLSLLR